MSDLPSFWGGAIFVSGKSRLPYILSEHKPCGVPTYDITGCVAEIDSAHAGPYHGCTNTAES